jgi:pimeloyl-ACP methyl ester carboxylesterase
MVSRLGVAVNASYPDNNTKMIQSNFSSLNPHGFHRVAYTDWGNAANPHVVLCVHGLTRNARDFDELARGLKPRCRVVCMDVVGRGGSAWLEHKDDYTFRQYQADAAALIARATDPHGRSVLPRWARSARGDVDGKVDWVGTSMGGLIGMLVAAQPHAPIRRLVLNDVGPFIPWAALIRLKGYLGSQTRFASLQEVERALREACAQWGPITDEQWRRLALHSAQPLEDGAWQMACDPAVGVATAWGWNPDAKVGNRNLRGLELWSVWEAIRCPTLVLRGADSEVLDRDTVGRMRGSGPPTEVVELAGIGHAPSLMTRDQIEIVREFLLRPA